MFSKTILAVLLGYQMLTPAHAAEFPRRSKAKAFLLSVLLPGLGESYAGSKKMAAVFIGTECALWAGYAGFRAYGNWKEDDYRLYAAAHAGVNPAGKGLSYFADIENYGNIVEYNDAKLQQRRIDKLYPEHQGFDWKWDSEVSRRHFERMRVKRDQAFRNSMFVIGGIMINHLASGIDAIRIVRQKSNSEGKVRIGLAGLPEGGGMVFIVKRF
jgi:hypothetical protein